MESWIENERRELRGETEAAAEEGQHLRRETLGSSTAISRRKL